MNHDGPADTRLMGIIHEALRRDLRRARTALAADSPPGDVQRRAIAEQLHWLIEFLHAHHRTEDDSLYPMVVARDAGAAPIVQSMHDDHLAVAPAIDRLGAAVTEYEASPDAASSVVAAIDALEGPLLPHLRREEDEMMPVVSATLTDAELRAWDEEANIKTKSMPQLAREGHWLLDGLGPEDRDFVLHLVPAVPRFVMLHGFGRSYRRRAAAAWGPTRNAARRIQDHATCRVVVDADIDSVWDVARDPTRVGEWSHECREAEWLDGATEAVPGARFRGRNRQGIWRWSRQCEVLGAEPYELAFRTVPTLRYPDSTEWRIRLEPDGGGTAIEQSFRVLKAPPVLGRIYATLIPAHRDRTAALTDDLRRLGAIAATAPKPARTA